MMTPPPTFVPGMIARILVHYIKCDTCPHPHRRALCSKHARMVQDVAQPFYELPEEGETCRLCDMAEVVFEQYANDRAQQYKILGDPQGLAEAALNNRLGGIS